MKNVKKYQNKKFIVAVIAIFAGLCALSAAGSALAMANPAAIYCTTLGYQYTIEKTADGDFGICQFPDGSRVEEWKFFSGEEKQNYNYCGTKGYGTKTVSDGRCKYNSSCTLCVLADGSEKEVTELMNLKVPSADYSKDPALSILPTASPVIKDINASDTNNLIYLFVIIGVVVVAIIIAIVFYIKKRQDNNF